MTYLRYSDAGVNFYSNGLVASDGFLEKNPELANAMVAAVSESFEEAIKNPEDAAKAMDGKDPLIPAQDVVQEQWKQTIKLLATANTEGKKPGVNADADWTSTIKTLADAGLIESAGETSKYFNAAFAPK